MQESWGVIVGWNDWLHSFNGLKELSSSNNFQFRSIKIKQYFSTTSHHSGAFWPKYYFNNSLSHFHLKIFQHLTVNALKMSNVKTLASWFSFNAIGYTFSSFRIFSMIGIFSCIIASPLSWFSFHCSIFFYLCFST